MKNIAVIFAGGSGKRMNTKSKPKQFLELNGKPIIIYTIELFDNHPNIDGFLLYGNKIETTYALEITLEDL